MTTALGAAERRTGPAPELLLPLLAAAPGATGVAVAAVRDGRTALHVRGTTDRSGERPVDGRTRFEVGSLTKTFTALLLADAVARGEVGLDDPIARYLPPHAVPVHPGGMPITLLHLATHTSGLPRLPGGFLATAVPGWFSNPYAAYPPGRLLDSLGATRVRTRPGSRVHYSNLGVGLLGQVLAEAAGTPYPTLLTRRVLRPLGLERSTCDPTRAQATGYWHGRPRPPWAIPALPGAGALRCGAGDLLRYLEALLRPTGAGPLAAALADVQRRRLVLPRSGDGLCLVWNVRRTDGRDLFFHSGGTRGFSAFAGFCPADGTALAAVANTTPAADGGFIQSAYSALRALGGGARPDQVGIEVR